MPETVRRRVSLEIPWKTLLKILAAAVLVWLWFQLYQVFLLLVVAVLLAVTLNPVVCWLQARGWARWVASGVVSLALLAAVVGFLWLTWSSLAAQAEFVVSKATELEESLTLRLPGWMRDSIRPPNSNDVTSYLAPYAMRIAQSTTSAVGYGLLGFFLMIYLLIEGRETREWLLAFVPRPHRAKAERTLDECERVIFAYAAGNALTSLIAFVFTLAVLWWLKVPAALLLAVMAGLSDFVPVVGFIVSSIPAIVLALTVSGTTTILVVVAYIAYNTVESYFISPWAYGDRLKLSNVAIVLSFAIGAEVAGVTGALIGLPVAAIYPTIERIWLREQVGEDTVREHREIARKVG
jgi:predicted PurR-regulated permease PerM